MTKWFSDYGRRMTPNERSQKYKDSHRPIIKIRNSLRDQSLVYARQKELIAQNPERYLWRTAKRRAKKFGREFTISQNDIKIPKFCPVLNIPLIILNKGFPAHNSATLDRKDNLRGYTPDNIIVISFRANTLKKDATLEEITAIYKYMKTINKSTQKKEQ